MTTIINVADLAPPIAIEVLDYEAIVTRQKAKFAEFWELARASNPTLNLPTYDVAMLEFDPIVIDSQAESYREMLIRARVNDALRAVLPAFAKGTDLDHVVARAGVFRLPIARDENGNPTAWESDAQLLDRYLAAFAAPAAGSEDGYIYQAATAWPERHDIKPYDYATQGLNLSPGDVAVYLLAPNGRSVTDPELSRVVTALAPKRARPLTDQVSVRRTAVMNWALTAKLIIRRGASAGAVLADRRLAALAFGAARYHTGGLVTAGGALSALWDPNVVNVIAPDIEDVPHGPDKAPYLTAVNLTYEVEA